MTRRSCRTGHGSEVKTGTVPGHGRGHPGKSNGRANNGTVNPMPIARGGTHHKPRSLVLVEQGRVAGTDLSARHTLQWYAY